MKFLFSQNAAKENAAIAVGCFNNKKLTVTAEKIDLLTEGLLTASLQQSRFEGKKGETLSILAPKNLKASRIIVFGLGEERDITLKNLQDIGGALYAEMKGSLAEELQINVKGMQTSSVSTSEIGTHIASGLLLRSWNFNKYHTKDAKKSKTSLATITVSTDDDSKAETIFKSLESVANGVFFTRDMVTEPANFLYPASMAQRIESELKPLGVTVEVLGLSELKKLGMGAILGVGQGSVNEPKVVVMQWNGGSKDQKPLAFVGKGVTFDTGGINLKTGGANIEDMKYDMAGAGVVAGLMKSLAGRKAKINAVGVVSLVENMPSGTAIRPSDVLTSMSGQTIEVLNTDAEGRLVLSDALWYTQDRFKPQLMIDLATLTGAIVIALGDLHAGLFSNNDDLAQKLLSTGLKTGEALWRLPLSEAYDKEIDSTIADVKNVGAGRKAGSIAGAQFLQRFVNNVPWAHLDIAGVAWAEKPLPTAEKGATAFGVRLLDMFVQDFYENSKS